MIDGLCYGCREELSAEEMETWAGYQRLLSRVGEKRLANRKANGDFRRGVSDGFPSYKKKNDSLVKLAACPYCGSEKGVPCVGLKDDSQRLCSSS